jgi:formylglycine-generating enzyme required for sulfatase activity
MNAAAPRMIPVPPGEFWMGENADDKFSNDTERPRHLVRFTSPFALSALPVTVAEFRIFRPDHPDPGAPDWPVALVSWTDATSYCRWLSSQTGRACRLPSESEWERAARAGTATAFPNGDVLPIEAANYLYSEHGVPVGPGHRTPVGGHPANAFGFHDLHGNVAEWCADFWHPTYEGAPADGSAWLADGQARLRILRGGAWDYLPRLLRSSWRDALEEDSRRDNVGFRVACDALE